MVTVKTQKRSEKFARATGFNVEHYNLFITEGSNTIAVFHQGGWISAVISKK